MKRRCLIYLLYSSKVKTSHWIVIYILSFSPFLGPEFDTCLSSTRQRQGNPSRTFNGSHFLYISGGIQNNNRETSVFGLTEKSVLLPGHQSGIGNSIYGNGVFKRRNTALVAVHSLHICHLYYRTSSIHLDIHVCSTDQSRYRAGRWYRESKKFKILLPARRYIIVWQIRTNVLKESSVFCK